MPGEINESGEVAMSSDDDDRVDLAKRADDAAAETVQPEPDAPLDFDPYRFGLPEHPVPPEFAPPGYKPPQPAAPQQPAQWSPYGPGSPYGAAPPSYAPPTNAPPTNAPPTNAPPTNGYGYPPPAGYGYPPPHGYGYPPPAAVVGKTGRGKAITALVLGIASIALFWVWIVDAVLAVLAVIFAVIAFGESRSPARQDTPERGAERSKARGMAIGGLACGLIGALLAGILTYKVVDAVHDCGGFSHADRSGFQQCIDDQI